MWRWNDWDDFLPWTSWEDGLTLEGLHWGGLETQFWSCWMLLGYWGTSCDFWQKIQIFSTSKMVGFWKPRGLRQAPDLGDGRERREENKGLIAMTSQSGLYKPISWTVISSYNFIHILRWDLWHTQPNCLAQTDCFTSLSLTVGGSFWNLQISLVAFGSALAWSRIPWNEDECPCCRRMVRRVSHVMKFRCEWQELSNL